MDGGTVRKPKGLQRSAPSGWLPGLRPPGTGAVGETAPPVGQALIKSDVGYHIRAGGHSVEPFDWQRFLEFAEYHLQKKGRGRRGPGLLLSVVG